MSTDVQARYLALRGEMRAIEGMPIGLTRERAVQVFYAHAAHLVADTNAQEPGPLLLQGVAARMMRRWEVAAQCAKAVTVLLPDFVLAWLDLTWALASLGRLEEAESCARRAIALEGDNIMALGNLASILSLRDKVDEAYIAIARAVEIDPANTKNQLILARVQQLREQPMPDEPVPNERVPWYRSLWNSWKRQSDD